MFPTMSEMMPYVQGIVWALALLYPFLALTFCGVVGYGIHRIHSLQDVNAALQYELNKARAAQS